MSCWSTFPFIRITIFFIAGIVWAYGRPLPYPVIWSICGSSIALYAALLTKRIGSRKPWQSLCTLQGLMGSISLFLAGAACLTAYRTQETLFKTCSQADDLTAYVAVVLDDDPAPNSENALNVTVAVQQAYIQGKWQKVTGKVQLYIKIANLASPPSYAYGDTYLILGKPQRLVALQHPGTFDYNTFLAYNNIYYRHSLTTQAIKKIAYAPPNPLQAFVFKIRKLAKKILSFHIEASRERSIVLALILGVKDELDASIRDAYASSGTMHVLAVSGLHVGILYTVLSFLLCRRKTYQRQKWFPMSMTLLCLWLYAGITGLSPSVFRATLMVSFIALANLLNKTHYSYNALAASAFLLLLWNPLWIFSVSFQLSYLAVVGIIYLQPKIYSCLNFKNIILRQLWLWTSVSLAAQGATTPLSLYYFHQFPVYFIIANWIVVPAAFFIFVLGLMVLLTSFWHALSAFFAYLLEQLTWCINESVHWINQLPYNVYDNIYLSTYDLYLYYALILVILLFWYQKTVHLLVVSITLVSFLILKTLHQAWHDHIQQGIRVYSIPYHTVLEFVKGRYSLLLVDDKLSQHTNKIHLHTNATQLAQGTLSHTLYSLEEACTTHNLPLGNWYGLKVGIWGKKKFVIMDQPLSSWPSLKQRFCIDFVIIANNSITSLQPLMALFQFDHLIVTSSNSQGVALHLQEEAKRLPIQTWVWVNKGTWEMNW